MTEGALLHRPCAEIIMSLPASHPGAGACPICRARVGSCRPSAVLLRIRLFQWFCLARLNECAGERAPEVQRSQPVRRGYKEASLYPLLCVQRSNPTNCGGAQVVCLIAREIKI